MRQLARKREKQGRMNTTAFSCWWIKTRLCKAFLHVEGLTAYFPHMKWTLYIYSLLLPAPTAFSAELWWPQFRGPNCSGVSETARPPAAFGPGTNQIWKTAVLAGMSSPVVWNDRVF